MRAPDRIYFRVPGRTTDAAQPGKADAAKPATAKATEVAHAETPAKRAASPAKKTGEAN
jgi:hypothetical protein